MLVFGISDNDEVGLVKPWGAEFISEAIKTKLDAVPVVDMEFRQAQGKTLILLRIEAEQETPHYYTGEKQRDNCRMPYRL